MCVVGEKAVGDTDLINVKKAYCRQAPFARFSALVRCVKMEFEEKYIQ